MKQWVLAAHLLWGCNSFGQPAPSDERSYPQPFEQVWEALLDMTAEDYVTTEIGRDADEGTILIVDSSGTQIQIRARRLNDSLVQIHVSSDPSNESLNRAIHERIARTISEGLNPVVFGAWLERTYDASLEEALQASEQALKSLRYRRTELRRGSHWLILEGKTLSGGPLRILLIKEDWNRTQANFLFGTEDSPANRNSAYQLKETFEDALRRISRSP